MSSSFLEARIPTLSQEQSSNSECKPVAFEWSDICFFEGDDEDEAAARALRIAEQRASYRSRTSPQAVAEKQIEITPPQDKRLKIQRASSSTQKATQQTQADDILPRGRFLLHAAACSGLIEEGDAISLGGCDNECAHVKFSPQHGHHLVRSNGSEEVFYSFESLAERYMKNDLNEVKIIKKDLPETRAESVAQIQKRVLQTVEQGHKKASEQ